MYTYKLTTSTEQVDAAIKAMTGMGVQLMLQVGENGFSYFDEGIVEGSGIWGECLVSEAGHKSSGVVNRLRDLGLWVTGSEDDADSGLWWALTALGADVANTLAGRIEKSELEVRAEKLAEEREAQITVKTGTKWTYLYAADGSVIAELRNDKLAAIAAHLS